MVLYSNLAYLEKYHKRVPITWDELIETAQYIMDQERQNNNSDLIGYNGFFSSTYIFNIKVIINKNVKLFIFYYIYIYIYIYIFFFFFFISIIYSFNS